MNLPSRPSLDQLRNLARERQRADGGRLADAQLALAREYGFPSWTRLKRHVEGLRSREARVAAYVADALERVVEPDPEIADEPIVRVLTGHVADLDPRAPVGPDGWDPVFALARSARWRSQGHRTAMRAALADLLARGGNPDAGPDDGSALFYLCDANDTDAVALMLDAGSRASVWDVMYHAAEHRDHRTLRLLLDRGFEPHGTNVLARMLDFEDPEGLDLLLTKWPERDEEMDRALHHALDRGRGAWAVAALLRAGADPAARKDGVSVYARARMLGREDVAALLTLVPLTPEQAFVAGEGPAPAEFDGTAGWFAVRFAERGDLANVRRLLDGGLSPDARGEGGQTALHAAAWNGRPEVARLLLDRGADPALRENWHDGTPLNWAVLAWVRWTPGERDHAGTVAVLLAAKAPGDGPWLREVAKHRPDIIAALDAAGA